jgi:hypothetical protein
MGSVVSVDTAALGRAAGTVDGMAARVGALADGRGAPWVLTRAADDVQGSATGTVLDDLPGVLVDLVSGFESALTALSQGLTNAARAYEELEASTAAAADGGTVQR